MLKKPTGDLVAEECEKPTGELSLSAPRSKSEKSALQEPFGASRTTERASERRKQGSNV